MGLSREVQDSERGIFTFHGIIGYAIAVGLLLSILVGLEIWALNVQQANATNVYKIENIHSIKAIDSENTKFDIANN